MKEEQNSRPLNAPTDGNGDREKKEREINMQVMERFIRFINTGDCGIGEGIISPNVVFYAPTSPEPMHGFKGYKDVLDMMRGAMPDVKWTAEEIIADGNKVMVRFTMSGTHTNPFMGMPATGRPISVTAMNIYELKDGKIIREHGLPDLFSMLIQLGMLSAHGQELQD
ncbi:putative uncharacterized protein [Prevotella sp. CAG:1124]|mgnify:FL=1|nr:putative uncharacterized protein [Prevotella sp. CAG:1124]